MPGLPIPGNRRSLARSPSSSSLRHAFRRSGNHNHFTLLVPVRAGDDLAGIICLEDLASSQHTAGAASIRTPISWFCPIRGEFILTESAPLFHSPRAESVGLSRRHLLQHLTRG